MRKTSSNWGWAEAVGTRSRQGKIPEAKTKKEMNDPGTRVKCESTRISKDTDRSQRERTAQVGEQAGERGVREEMSHWKIQTQRINREQEKAWERDPEMERSCLEHRHLKSSVLYKRMETETWTFTSTAPNGWERMCPQIHLSCECGPHDSPWYCQQLCAELRERYLTCNRQGRQERHKEMGSGWSHESQGQQLWGPATELPGTISRAETIAGVRLGGCWCGGNNFLPAVTGLNVIKHKGYFCKGSRGKRIQKTPLKREGIKTDWITVNQHLQSTLYVQAQC